MSVSGLNTVCLKSKVLLNMGFSGPQLMCPIFPGVQSAVPAPVFMPLALWATLDPKPWVLPPLRNSWIRLRKHVSGALQKSANIDCYRVGAVHNLNPTCKEA